MSRLRHLFSLQSRVTRRDYFVTGAVLMIGKYLIDAAVIKIVSGVTWTPVDYFVPMVTLRAEKVNAFPAGLEFFLLAWSLPFLWIGVSMTFRRAIDAGKSGWLALWFFVPIVNYAMMLWIAALPSAATTGISAEKEIRSEDDSLRSALYGLAAGLVIGLIGIALSVFEFQEYGLTLFLGLPLFAGSVAAYVFNRGASRSQGATDRVVVSTIALIGAAMLLFALEGVVCLAMAFPIAFVLAFLGGRIGRGIALAGGRTPLSPAVILFLPAGLFADRAATAHGPPTIEVVTTVEVAAPPLVVWKNVVQFNEIAPPSEWYFRAGIAYPISATISGTGIGAIRRCVFSTGAFVEPITAWKPGKILAFGVTAQPQPLQEWSPYRRVYAPHLNGFFVSERGEFRLIPLANGGTRLEGHTWYHNNMYPQNYWRLFSDPILHRIHTRVLNEVKREAEAS